MPNGQTSWINGVYAIWYNSGYWLVGPLDNIGEFVGYMFASNDFYGLTDDENEWNYLYYSSWYSPTDPTDIKVGFSQKVMAEFSNFSNCHSCEPKIVSALLIPVNDNNKILAIL